MSKQPIQKVRIVREPYWPWFLDHPRIALAIVVGLAVLLTILSGCAAPRSTPTDYAVFLEHVANWTEPLDVTAEQAWLDQHPPQTCYAPLWAAIRSALSTMPEDAGGEIVTLMDQATARCLATPPAEG